MTFRIITIETPTLGDRSYLVHDGTDALVIDPPTSAGTWTLSVSTCGLQELADTTNTICGTWYATLDVQA